MRSCVATWHGWMKSMDSAEFFETVSQRPELLPRYLDAAKAVKPFKGIQTAFKMLLSVFIIIIYISCVFVCFFDGLCNYNKA